MKATLALFTLMLSANAFAGDWMFSKTEVALSQPEPVAQVVRPRVAKPAKTGKPVEVRTPTSGDKKCSSKFNEAASFFKEVHGPGVDIARLGQFNGSFQDITSQNQFKNNGGQLYLNMIIGGMISTDVPVTVCRNGKNLAITLITSRATDNSVREMVQNGKAPKSITLAVNRTGNTLNFLGHANGSTVSASATLR